MSRGREGEREGEKEGERKGRYDVTKMPQELLRIYYLVWSTSALDFLSKCI